MANKITKNRDSYSKVERRSANESLAVPKAEFLTRKTRGYTLSQASTNNKPDTKKK